MKHLSFLLVTLFVFMKFGFAANTDRSVVALSTPSGEIYIGWRLFASDPDNIGFNLYRKIDGGTAELRNSYPIINRTNYIDAAPPQGATNISYFIVPLIDGTEDQISAEASLLSNNGNPFFEFEMHTSADFMFGSIADLDGDGLNDYIIQLPKKFIDPYCANWNSSGGGTFKLHAYNHNGDFLWEYDRGLSIEMGIWYAPYIAYDFDGDGKAEIALKAGEGDPRDVEGRVYSGNEYLKILNGETGTEITELAWPSRTGYKEESCEIGTGWEGYNLQSRNLISIAYLDSITPHIIVCRGTYGTQKVRAYSFDGNNLNLTWEWSNDTLAAEWRGQGAHFQHGADVDNDGKDEVILGSCVLDDDGTGLWTTGLGHVDHAYVADILPNRPGLEMYYGCESGKSSKGMGLVDASTGNEIWACNFETWHCHREGLCGDIDPDSPGLECYSQSRDNGAIKYLWSSDGRLLSNLEMGENPYSIFWDDDLTKEFIYNGNINKYRDSAFTSIENIEGRIVLIADFLGDWREEVIVAHEGKIRIYTSNVPTNYRFNCLLEDRLYKTDVATQSMGYLQSPMMSINLGQSVRKDCRGIQNGTYTIDKCGNCVEAFVDTLICPEILDTLEAEDFYCTDLSLIDGIESNNLGFSGLGAVNGSNSEQGIVTWVFTTNDNQSARIIIRYANGASNRPADILVNGEIQIMANDFPGTGDWSAWDTSIVFLNFTEGENQVQFNPVSSEGLPNIDHFLVYPDTVFKSIEAASECQAQVSFKENISELTEVYPNPTSGTIFVSTECSWELYNSYGTILYSGRSNKIDISELPDGIYFLRTEQNNHKIVKTY